jgi:four helix bundle protein
VYKSFKDMPIWQEAMKIAEDIFKMTKALPKSEEYALVSQLRRAALSISANIAEAYGRNHSADKVNFYYFARGSAVETQSHLEYSRRVGYISEAELIRLDSELVKIYNDLNKIVISLKNR